MDDPITEDLIATMCEGTIATWMSDYTDTLDDGRQRRITEVEEFQYLVLRVEDYTGDNPDRLFRIVVNVEEVKY